ncbi:MAG: Holliday junction resolvase RuvX [Alphaproteobacteria bacterium]|jgi:putative holliday junction resolvase|nr:Holliday junction resolvase RuvX [Alphaproteobacteria bacterium]
MPIIKKISLAKERKYNNQKIIAIDYGTRKFGLALSDQSLTIATPYANYQRRELKTDLEFISSEVLNNNINAIVIGLPKELNNEQQAIAQQVKSFANILSQNFTQDIFFWDERFSSRAAERLMQHKEFKGQNNDKYSACFILQAFLDFRKN